MTTVDESCGDLHRLLRSLPRHKFPPPFTGLPLNGVYFIFEANQCSHDSERVVRIGSHTGENNLFSRLWTHVTPHGRSIFRRQVGKMLLETNDPFRERVWNKKQGERKDSAITKADLKRLHQFEGEVSAYIGEHFTFCTIGTETAKEAIIVEKDCIATIGTCGQCLESKHKATSVKAGLGHLWNKQHVNSPPSLTAHEKLRALVGLTG